MSFRSALLAVLLSAACTSVSLAQSCKDPQTQADLTRCAVADASQADADLNAAYATLVKKFEGAEQERLREAQRAWIAFRDKECAFRTAGTEGGSIHPMAVARCAAELTRKRTVDLREASTCEEGDLNCVN